MNHYVGVLKKYAIFSGRASRSEYWYFTLVNFLIGFALGVIGGLLELGSAATAITVLYALAIVIPSLAVTVRRLHDTDRSGWWMLLALIPFGGIVLIVFMILDSTPGDNRFGPNPKGAGPTAPTPPVPPMPQQS